MYKLIFILLVSVFFQTHLEASTKLSHPKTDLLPFETDYCTGFSNGTWNHPNRWKSCCLEHDIAYWIGGSYEREKRSDLRLKECVRKSGGDFISTVMYLGVRLGHYCPFKLSKSWGWGFGSKKNYHKLTKSQKKTLQKKLIKMGIK